MPTIWISAEACKLIRRCAVVNIKEPKVILPNGSAYLEVGDDTLINLEGVMLFGEDYSGCIERLAALILGTNLTEEAKQ